MVNVIGTYLDTSDSMTSAFVVAELTTALQA